MPAGSVSPVLASRIADSFAAAVQPLLDVTILTNATSPVKIHSP
jgi:hypothetical protein